MLASLRKIQRLLSTPENLPTAAPVRPLIGMLKMNAPQHLPKLANCLLADHSRRPAGRTWKSTNRSSASRPTIRILPINRSGNGVGGPAGRSPQGMEAVFGLDRHAARSVSGRIWQAARAMIALRMGDNAAEHDNASDELSPENFLDFLRRELQGSGRKKPRSPPSSGHATRWNFLPTGKIRPRGLLDLYVDRQQWDKAEQIGRRLTERFPTIRTHRLNYRKCFTRWEKDGEGV
jgi:hypothetical protein